MDVIERAEPWYDEPLVFVKLFSHLVADQISWRKVREFVDSLSEGRLNPKPESGGIPEEFGNLNPFDLLEAGRVAMVVKKLQWRKLQPVGLSLSLHPFLRRLGYKLLLLLHLQVGFCSGARIFTIESSEAGKETAALQIKLVFVAGAKRRKTFVLIFFTKRRMGIFWMAHNSLLSLLASKSREGREGYGGMVANNRTRRRPSSLEFGEQKLRGETALG
jgi:hypothetical protein